MKTGEDELFRVEVILPDGALDDGIRLLPVALDLMHPSTPSLTNHESGREQQRLPKGIPRLQVTNKVATSYSNVQNL